MMSPREFYSLIGSVFGESEDYGRDDNGDLIFHAGQDYPWPEGTEIPSPGPGRVVRKGWTSEAGNYVTVLIGGLYLPFYHLVQPSDLEVGQEISFGTLVGIVGDTGNTDGAHLHLAVSNDPRPGYGNRRDPLPVVAALIAANDASAAGVGGTTNVTQTEEEEDDMDKYARPTNNADSGRVWAGDNREYGKVLFSGVWELTNPGARRLTMAEWALVQRAYAASGRKIPIADCTGNELEIVIFVPPRS